MTEKLFYTDPFCTNFTASVLSCAEDKAGFAVILDRSAFYPEGGGQPADHGTLGGVRVTDTWDKNGEVIHYCDGPLTVGNTVEGQVDWLRRRDLMQQHSGEHIVSGIICGRYHCDNVGFHIGHDLVTIDFNTELTQEDLRAVEAEANRYIWEDHEISIQYPTPEELQRIDYRSKKALEGQVRIVSWPGADCCACCGVHMARSGQVGLVKLLSVSAFREGVRIEMAAGDRALQHLSAIYAQNVQVSQLLSAKPMETAAAVERLQGEVYALRGRVASLEEGDFARKAQDNAGKGDVLLLEPPMSSESVRKLCDAVLAVCGGRCAVFSGENGVYKYAVGQKDGDLRQLVKELNQALSGRGGGKPAFAQGSVQADEGQIRGFFTAR